MSRAAEAENSTRGDSDLSSRKVEESRLHHEMIARTKLVGREARQKNDQAAEDRCLPTVEAATPGADQQFRSPLCYSITSSAMERTSADVTVRPSALPVSN
jgi:hypothetical protein